MKITYEIPRFIKPCPYATWIGCEENCRNNCTKTNCEFELMMQKIKPETQYLCLKDSNKNGAFNAIGVEAELKTLNSVDWRIEIGGEKKSVQLQDIIDLHGPILPLEINELKNANYSERASEWGCIIARALAKADFSKIGKFQEAEESIIGTASHIIYNQQHKPEGFFSHNKTLLGIPGGKLIGRNKYCEKSVALQLEKHSIAGHPDALCFFPEDPDHAIISLDQKHARYQTYEKKAYIRQHLAYCMAVSQMTGIEPKYFIGITIKRPFYSIEDLRRKRRYSITRIKNHPENKLIKDFMIYSKKSYDMQAEIFHSLDALMKLKDKKMVSKRGCINHEVIDAEPRACFNSDVCGVLCKMCEEQRKSLVEILDEFNALPKNFVVPGC